MWGFNIYKNKINNMLNQITRVLVIIGGLNWGLVGIGSFMGSDWNVVHMLLGSLGPVEAIVYVLVGVSAVMMALPRN